MSRVAVLTGMTRKEASRLMQDDPDEQLGDRMIRQVNRAARVVTAWVEDPEFHDGEGAPASLPFESSETPAFTDLVSKHGADVGARAVLDELVRVGAVAERADGHLYLTNSAYIPSSDEGAKLDILGTDVADLVAAIDNNLDPDRETPLFQREGVVRQPSASYLRSCANASRSAARSCSKNSTPTWRHMTAMRARTATSRTTMRDPGRWSASITTRIRKMATTERTICGANAELEETRPLCTRWRIWAASAGLAVLALACLPGGGGGSLRMGG